MVRDYLCSCLNSYTLIASFKQVGLSDFVVDEFILLKIKHYLKSMKIYWLLPFRPSFQDEQLHSSES